MSKFGLTALLLFIFLSAIGRILFPFGDEPDYQSQLERLNSQDKLIYNPYNYTKLYEGIPSEHNCLVSAGSYSLWAKFNNNCLDLNFKYFFSRISLTLLLTLPLLLTIFYRRYSYKLFRTKKVITFDEWNDRLDAVSLSILFPSLIYMLGLVSEEVFILVCALYVFVFWGRPIIITCLLFMIGILDNGNFIVVFGFSGILYSLNRTYNLLGMRVMLILSASMVACSYFFGEIVLSHLASMHIQSKFEQIYISIVDKSAYDNYPLILRPIITYLSFIFMTAASVKSILLYILVSIGLIYASLKGIASYYSIQKEVINSDVQIAKAKDFSFSIVAMVSVATTIFCFVFMLPTHGYAKYYVFMMPFVIYFLLQFISKWKIMATFVIFSIVLFANIMAYYV